MFTILIFGDGFVCISKLIKVYTEFILYQLYLNKNKLLSRETNIRQKILNQGQLKFGGNLDSC